MEQKINSLINQLNQLKAAPSTSGKKKKNRKKKGGATVPGAMSMPVAIKSGGGRRKRRSGGTGDITVSRTELFITATASPSYSSQTFTQVLAPDSFAWLKGIASSFENYRFNSVSLQWRSAVGTTKDGVVCYGLDWAFVLGASSSRAKVTALTPVCDHPVWQSSSAMRLPAKHLATRPWFTVGASKTDGAPGQVALNLQCGTDSASALMGELWVTYSVTFVGTR